jgi:prepilin-type N-terminal cleavage/methylation domain-containing protein
MGMRRAFSLIELSIVLVILGLLTGGILAGKSLIEAAQTKKIAGDVQKYATAVYAFRERYFQYPGDMNNATQFWGASDPVFATCRLTPSTGISTCDGNGDGFVGGTMGNTLTTYQPEALFVWKHLANAGLVAGSFTGVPETSSYPMEHISGVNCPPGPIDKTCFGLVSQAKPPPGHAYLWPGEYGVTLRFGKAYKYDPLLATLSAERTWNIDTKIDDGMPGIGRMVTRDATALPDCTAETDGNNYRTAEYLLTSTAPDACAFYYRRL